MLQDALIVIDLQRGVHTLEAPLYGLNKVIKGVNDRIDLYREANKAIIFVQHFNETNLVKGSKPWELFSVLKNEPTDSYIDKDTANSFYNTTLLDVLKEKEINSIEFCGAQTEYCVDTAVRFAQGSGYSCYVTPGLHTTSDSELLAAEQIIAHHDNIWRNWFLNN
ncbi:cysteine hydrolase family protein [Vagococcus fessus]|uniref:Isochorismatase-like domain-containing protein n=1 Tax=Vagococcus fessus TaxID=120370 RepID=A0A430ACD8_9ENTE|nr:cysteine hydrolase family protein [Vagococcus fessus]RSU04882.1 hypothetical protein CBF31_02355 [Vagococcus fessus]